jgi:hypothetical protein
VSRPGGRTAPCSRADAQSRFRRAEAFLYVADLVLGEEVAADGNEDAINLSGVAAALAVLAGIAAADAACCHSLGVRSRGQDHRQAVAHLETVVPDGPAMASDLDRLLDLKDNAHYGVLGVSQKEARSAVARAGRIVAAAKAILTAP